MRDNKHTIVILAALLLSAACQAQSDPVVTQQRNDYSLIAYLSGGFGYYPNEGPASYLKPRFSKYNPVATARIMWHPDHLVRVGIESGYTSFYTYSFTDSAGNNGHLEVNAVPLLIEWSMTVAKRLNFLAGSGIYFLTTKLDYLGKVSSPKASVGWVAAASYVHPLSKNTGLGAEVKWMHAAETRDGILSVQLQVVWKFISW